MADVQVPTSSAPHVPVLLAPLLRLAYPVAGVWVDGTFGAGGYTRGLLAAGADKVIGIDRDPRVFALATPWISEFGDRLQLIESDFAAMADHASEVDGVVLDLGVSSMQIDEAERGFSFQKDGPLDMRMGREGLTAADLVNTLDEGSLADLLYLYGEERQSRRIARAIVAARPFSRTLELAEVIAAQLPRQKPGQSHPATRSFQALRIAVNDEFGQIYKALLAAERILNPGGFLGVVTFHSIEDRIVKRFFQNRTGKSGGGSRYMPEAQKDAPTFDARGQKAVAPDTAELEENPRARSARLRVAWRTTAPARDADAKALGVPQWKGQG